MDMLLIAEHSTGAYGSNVVTCKEPSSYFDLSKISAGPRKDTMLSTPATPTPRPSTPPTARAFPSRRKPFAPGDAYVPEGREKNGKLVIDLVTRKIAPQ